MEDKLDIPSFLHELHGTQSNWLNIFLTYLCALLATLAVLKTTDSGLLLNWQKYVLIALSIDLGGGVFSNFTFATSKYYADSFKRSMFFITLHLLQPLVLSFIFPAHLLGITFCSVYILTSALLLNFIHQPEHKLSFAVFFTFAGFLSLQINPLAFSSALQLLFSIFLLKLSLAFAVPWHVLGSQKEKSQEHSL
ncbi:hypothetical protein PZB74_14205 [Porifericola rhodea]|uniref:hypothetical protein n=1 Tax=Porifericola rhodea TaxID=930972 RepID=UPI002666C96C|nr:hypothetical protein [Porifericola rhodea]WKN30114.1 hypothetical protein PZB74_14205 [Porifericola rhodea]